MTRSVTNLRHWRAVADESGGMTVFGLYITLIALVLGGLALDVSNAIRMRTMLQMTADSAAHAYQPGPFCTAF